MGTLAGKAHAEKKTSPVKHELPSKDVGEKKKDKDKEPESSEAEVPAIPGIEAV